MPLNEPGIGSIAVKGTCHPNIAGWYFKNCTWFCLNEEVTLSFKFLCCYQQYISLGEKSM